ncbi:MAG: hypothetical protein GX564_02290, partial [Oligosphaeraceae bacterium]|nr:hypothetical protein [Oligosphaeraceae bacterium]
MNRWNRTMAFWSSLEKQGDYAVEEMPGYVEVTAADKEAPGGVAAKLLLKGVDNNGDSVISMYCMHYLQTDMTSCETEAAELGYAESTDEQGNRISALQNLCMVQSDYIQEMGKNSPSVCAKVSLEIKQTLTMTREAFDGTLTMVNGHETDDITNLKLDVRVTDLEGNDCTNLFEIFPLDDGDYFAIDGNGTVPAKGTGTAVVRFIPEREAAPDTAKAYSFGGTLSYLNPFSGQTTTIELTPCTLEVQPSPALQIHYFLARDILGDDPMTIEVEPSYPAELSVLVYNDGYGTAKNFRIDSGQPKITDNEKGLLIDFALWDYETTDSMLNGTPNNLPLGQVNLGDIGSKKTGLAQWWLTCSLLGHFVGMEASYSHLSSRGNPDLSLIDSVDIHELVRSGRTLDDTATIFLVNDKTDTDDMPETLWFSNNASNEQVLSANHSLSADPQLISTGSDHTYTFTISAHQAGWHYIVLDDPGDGRYEIVSFARGDTVLPVRNCWLTTCTLRDGEDPVYENKLRLMDLLAADTSYEYTITVAKLPDQAVEVTAFAATSSNDEDVADYMLTGDIERVTVTFSSPILPETFTSDDLILRRQGVLLSSAELAAALLITPAVTDPEEANYNQVFYIDGLGSLTNQNAFFVLTVQCAGISDQEGFPGASGKQLIWVRQDDFNELQTLPPPVLLSLERIIPEAGLEGQFDVQLTFLGYVLAESVTLGDFQLKKNSLPVDLTTLGVAVRATEVPGVFIIDGLDTPDVNNNFYVLSYDASNAQDIKGSNASGTRSVAWGNDFEPPALLTDLHVTPDSGRSATDACTQYPVEGTLNLAGTLPEVPAYWQLFLQTAPGGELQPLTELNYVAEGESASLSIPLDLTDDGTYHLLLRVEDLARNSNDNAFIVLLDNLPPVPPLTLLMTPNTGSSDTDFITRLETGAEITFTAALAENLLQVEVLEGEAVLLDAGVQDSAEPGFTVSLPLDEGSHELILRLTDAAGNVTTVQQTVLIDNTAPAFNGLVFAPDLGLSGSDLVTSGNTFSVSTGVSEYPLEMLLGNGEQNWPQTVTAGDYSQEIVLADGVYVLTLQATDLAGNTTVETLNVTVDNSAPAAIGDTAVVPDRGLVPDDGITCLLDGETIHIAGAVPETSSRIELLYQDTVVAGQNFAAGSDDLSFLLDSAISAPGDYEMLLRLTDLAGNTAEKQLQFTIDNTAPGMLTQVTMQPNTGADTADWLTALGPAEVLTLNGVLPELPARVDVYLQSAPETILASAATAAADGNPNVVLSLPVLTADGSYDLCLAVTDLGGNTSVLPLTVVIDNAAPGAVTGLGISPDTGRSETDLLTSPSTAEPLTIFGTLPEGALLVEWFAQSDERQSLGEKLYGAEETALSQTLVLADGQYDIIVKLTDAAGNASESTLTGLVVDTTPPTAP